MGIESCANTLHTSLNVILIEAVATEESISFPFSPPTNLSSYHPIIYFLFLNLELLNFSTFERSLLHLVHLGERSDLLFQLLDFKEMPFEYRRCHNVSDNDH